MMKRLLLLCALQCSLAFGSYEETFMEFLEQSGAKQLMTPSTEYIARIVGDSLPENANLTKSQKQTLYTIIANTTKATITESLPQIQALYQRYFSESELRDIIAFYRTPVGKKLAANLLPMQEKTQKIVFGIMQKHLPTMIQQITNVLNPQQKGK